MLKADQKDLAAVFFKPQKGLGVDSRLPHSVKDRSDYRFWMT